MYLLNVNGVDCAIEADAERSLLWVLREKLGLIEIVCGLGSMRCDHCKVLIDGVPTRSCALPISEIAETRRIETLALL